MPVLLGFINNSNNTAKNPTAHSEISRSTTLSRRRHRRNTGDTGTFKLQEPANSRNTTKPFHIAAPADKCGPTLTELKITPPFPALKLSSLSLRSKSNPRASRHSSRSPSPTSDPVFSSVLAPSPIITRTTSNGDGLISSNSLCHGDYWSQDQNSDNQVTPSGPTRELWSKRSSEHISVTPETLTDTPRITITAFPQPANTMTEFESSPQIVSSESLPVPGLTRSVSETIVNFARRSWSSPAVSRSSSPSSRDAVSTKSGDSSSTTSSTSSATPPTVNGEGSAPPKLKSNRRNSISSLNKSRRPISSMFGRAAASESTVPTLKSQSLSVENSPLRLPGRKVKDELWDSFRGLESDYNRFQNKASPEKAKIIRQSLIPFLRNSAKITCNNIEPDELDRRVRLLHRWWTGLLAQLQNRSPSAIAGSDRPLYLEGVSAILSRPEWRPPQSEFSPLSEQISKSHSSASLSSDSSRYSVEKSVQHNIKALFTRTIIDTLAYAVGKMGQRTAPASIVAFAGKVVAYAFYFCNGAAEVLINLWNIPAVTLKRVLQQNGIQRSTDLHHIFDEVVIRFPECLHPLSFTNLAGALRQLKKSVKPPLGNTVDWYGAWVNRWLGRDSDLLFVFLKYYHILLCGFMPSETSELSQACAPGFIFIQAHMLNIMDSTLHSKPQKTVPGPIGPSTTFDDVLAKASTLLVPTHRTMAENKLIVLLRDVLTDSQLCSARCCSVLSKSFSTMLMAAAQRTKVFDSDACFTLCDMVEEILPILNYSEKLEGGGATYIDWPFWLDVFKRMSNCDNNMTELRLICMVFTIWGLLTEEDGRKHSLCMDWLLSPPTWERFFCHWCPMVRAYFMRLICWRLARFTGNESGKTDKDILRTAFLRLRTCFAHHTRLKEKAEKGLIALPSTNPSLPAPGRRLIILRSDAIVPPPGILYAEDGLISLSTTIAPVRKARSSAGQSSPNERPSTPVRAAENAKSNDSSASAKKRWNILRTLGFQSNSPSPPASPESPGLNQKGIGRFDELDMDFPDVPASTNLQRKATFKFSLEWMAQQPFNVRDKHLNPARLPIMSQTFVDSLGEDVPEIVDLSDCTNLDAGYWTYSGRALSEWVLVVVEYENFFERRKSEGKEADSEVETPSLCVESLRKL
ncbi:hypothetical protein EV426DRAFT_703982 [Tirmania nivea]|nr:hypothetical protein EV426DRAFT_703982 [Tirmania nivea]